MLELRRYIAGDAALIEARTVLADARSFFDPELLSGRQTPPGKAWTLTRDKHPIGVGGLIPIWPGRFAAWTWIGDLDARTWAALSRMVRRVLDDAQDDGARRIEAETAAGWREGEFWLQKLGFDLEGVARAYAPDGADMAIYARVR